MDHGVVTKPPVLFIGGSGRSGTNITRKILALHPDVATLPFEYRFIIDPNGIIDFYNGIRTTWSPYYFDSKLKQLEQFLRSLAQKSVIHQEQPQGEVERQPKERYNDWELDRWVPGFSNFITLLIHEIVEFSYEATWPGIPNTHSNDKMVFTTPQNDRLQHILGRFIARCVNAILEQESKSVFVEDNTWNILYAKELLEIYPTGKILHIVRDPRDVIASLRLQRWTPVRLVDLVVWYSEVMKKSNGIKGNLSGDQFFEIRLEDLVDSTESTLTEVLGFIGLPFHENVLNLPLNKAHRGRWKTDFDLEEKELVQRELSGFISQYNY